MAELLFPNIIGQFQQGQAFGTEMRQNREAEGRRNRLADLAAQAYGADPSARPGLLQQAIGVDPQAGLALSGNLAEEDKRKEQMLLNTARLIDSAPPEMKDAIFQQVRPQIQQYLPNLPPSYTPQVEQGIKAFIQSRTQGSGEELKSVRVGGNGNYWAIRGGQFVDTGVPADPRYKIMEGAGGIYGINERTLGASPVQLPGAPPQQGMPAGMYQTPGGMVRVGDDMSPEDAALIQADVANNGQADQYTLPPRDVSPQQFGGQLQPAPKTPAGYQAVPGGLAPIPGGPAQVAMDARADAAAARKAAEETKADAKRQVTAQRQGEAVAAAEQLVGSIDQLMQSPGFEALGTALGDAQINIPLVRTAAKDADAQLKNIAGQVALTTMARLKALSSQGATGFGALTAPELKLLENSIATLQAEKVSNQELKRSLKTIRDKMEKITSWQAPAEQEAAPSGVLRWNPQTQDFE